MKQIRFHFKYFCVFLVLFLTEFAIAVFVRDTFIRPFVGDVLVICLLYAGIRVFWGGSKTMLVSAVLMLAFLVEIGQYFDLIKILNIQDVRWATIVIGSTFDVLDLCAYVAGAVLLMFPDIAGVRVKWFP